jgi:folate-binding protein YgfZ
MKSALLSRPGAVPEQEDSTVAWHYGDPLREQRHLAQGGAIVDRGDRGLLRITGPERLSWLHSLTSQHLTALAAGHGSELLVLSPNGHIEHHAGIFDDGTAAWLDSEAASVTALRDFLTKMRFFTQVDIDDVSGEYTLATTTGATDLPAPDALPTPGAKFASGTLPHRSSVIYSGQLTETGWRRRSDTLGVPTVDHLVPREHLDALVDTTGLPPAGTWAYDTLRIPALCALTGVDTDHKAIPHELPGLLRDAVHLDKGCYRGQETVARVHNMGKPPRRLVMLHLDGSQEQPPAPGAEITAAGRVVGRVGTAGRHYEDGMIALALLKRTVADKPHTELDVAGSAAVVAG